MKVRKQNKGPPSPSGGDKKRKNAGRTGLLFRRILVPLDFSGKSRQALNVAVPLAQRYGGRILLIHIVEPVYTYAPFPGGNGAAPLDPNPLEQRARETLDALADELVPRELLAETIVNVGQAWHGIVEAAHETEADLIVIATHGFTGLKHTLLGSTTERVVRHAHCPVLTVRRR